jgi:hypothetical protein
MTKQTELTAIQQISDLTQQKGPGKTGAFDLRIRRQ